MHDHESGKQPHSSEPVIIGHITHITGSHAKILLLGDLDLDTNRKGDTPSPYIGTLLTVDTERAMVLGLITSMNVPGSALDAGNTDIRIAEVDLVGELPREPDGYVRTFRRGVSVYPRLGDKVKVASNAILQKAYYLDQTDAVSIGCIHQDPTVPAAMKIDQLLGKHFAIVGSTGTGKSCTVALILRQILRAHQNGHVVLLDPHNEYGECFGEQSNVIQLDGLSIPYWFLSFEEIVEIIIGDAQKHSDEVDILRDLIPSAKRHFASKHSRIAPVALQQGVLRERYSVDVPTPYRMSDVVGLIDAQMGRLEMQKELGPFKRLKARIESISQDPRYTFMFGSLTVNDNLSSELKRLFRVPVAGKPITVVQLMGLPSEVLNVVVSVLARLAFDVAMWSDGKIPITFVCEEAHRYVPRDTGSSFEPTKRAIARIAKEGRKYGVSLCVVSQRPGDIDPPILSQCSTLITMRLSSARDQDIVQAAVSDATASLLDFLPALGTREALVFGEGFALPSRVYISELPANCLPKSETARFSEAWASDIADDGLLDEIVSRWRMTAQSPDEPLEDTEVIQPDGIVLSGGQVQEGAQISAAAVQAGPAKALQQGLAAAVSTAPSANLARGVPTQPQRSEDAAPLSPAPQMTVEDASPASATTKKSVLRRSADQSGSSGKSVRSGEALSERLRKLTG